MAKDKTIKVKYVRSGVTDKGSKWVMLAISKKVGVITHDEAFFIWGEIAKSVKEGSMIDIPESMYINATK